MQVLSREARSLLEPPKPGTVHDKQESEAPRTYRQHHDSYIYRQAAAISFMPVSVLHLRCMQTARPNAPFAAARAGRTRCASRCATSAATSAAACRRGQGRTRATSAAPLLRHHGQSKNRQAQVPLGRRQAAITDVSDLETSFNSPCHVCSLQ